MKPLFYICLLFLNILSIKAQDNNLNDAFTLRKIITYQIPRYADGANFKVKYRNNEVYLLGEDFIKNNEAVFFRENISSGIKDTFFLNMNFSINNVSDFGVFKNELLMMNNGSFLSYNLNNGTYNSIKIPSKMSYRHFYFKDSNTVILYEWQIGDRMNETKPVIQYNLETDQFEEIASINLSGVDFLGITRNYKYVDVSDHTMVRVKASAYEIYIKNLRAGNKWDTIKYRLDSANFISEKRLDKLHASYVIKPSRETFDSIFSHCKNKTQIYAVKIVEDSILYVYYENIMPECYWIINKTTKYMDIWVFDQIKSVWVLKHANLRLDNRSVCKKMDLKELSKENMSFSLSGIEKEWGVTDRLMIIPKLIATQVNLESGDLSQMFNPDNNNGFQNLHLFVLQLK